MSIDDGGNGEFRPAITEVNVQPVNEDRLKAFVTLVFEDNFVVHGVKVIQAANKTFVAMPTRRNPSGAQTDVCHPINREFRQYVEETVLRAWARRLEDDSIDPGSPDPEAREREPRDDDDGEFDRYPPH